jgi:AraC-like DNA-binding protein
MSSPPPLPRLPLGHLQAGLESDPDALAERLGRAVPLRDLAPLEGDRPFAHRSCSVRIDPLEITAASHTPLHGANHAQRKMVFTLPFQGEKRFLINGRPYHARAGHNALLLPGEAYTLETSLCSGVVFSVCPEAVATVAAAMAGPATSLRLLPVQQPVELLERHPPQGNLLSLLRRTLGLIDLIDSPSSHLPARLGLGDKILRLLALLLHPQLLERDPADEEPLDPREASAFADLISALQANLSGKWSLTLMEQRSGLSRGRLQRHFETTFGCSPLEWLRVQRLCWARRRLESEDDLSLLPLARDCGFANLEEFRAAFASRFQLQPEWLRGNA